MSKRITTEASGSSLIRRIGWFVAIWAISIVVVAGVAEGLKYLILG